MDSDDHPEPTSGSTVVDTLSDGTGLESIPDAVVIAEANTRRIVYANPAANDLFQCQPGELIGRHQTDLHPEEEADAYAEAFERGLQGQRVNRLRSGDPLFIEPVGGDDEAVPVEITVQTISADDGEYLMGVFRDISEQLARERALKRTTGRLETLLETLPVPVAVLDTDSTVVRWNRAAEETFGYPADQIVGQQYSLFTDAEEFASLLERVCEGETLQNYRTALRAKDGSRVPAELSARPVYEDGSVSEIAGTAIDLSSQRQRKQQLDVLYRVARHNLRNELNIIQGWAETIRGSDTEYSDAATEIMNASDRLIQLSDRMKNFRRPTNQETHGVAPQEVNVLVSTVSDQLRTNDGVVKLDITTGSIAGQVRATAAEAISELCNNMFECDDGAAVRVEADCADTHTELSVRSDTPLLCSGERVLIQQGTETPLNHATGLAIAQSYLTIRRIGGSVSLGPGLADTPAADLRVELPRIDT